MPRIAVNAGKWIFEESLKLNSVHRGQHSRNHSLLKYNPAIWLQVLPPRPGTNLLISFSNTSHQRLDLSKQRFQWGFGFSGITENDVNKFMNKASVTVHYENE